MSFMIGNLYHRVVFCNFNQEYFMQKGRFNVVEH